MIARLANDDDFQAQATRKNRARAITSPSSASATAASPAAEASTTTRPKNGAIPIALARNNAVSASAAGPRTMQHAQPAT